jgi:glutathione S-transferase
MPEFLDDQYGPHDGLTLFGSLTSNSTYMPMLYLALARLPFSFRTVNLKYGLPAIQYLAVNRYGQAPALRRHSRVTDAGSANLQQ